MTRAVAEARSPVEEVARGERARAPDLAAGRAGGAEGDPRVLDVEERVDALPELLLEASADGVDAGQALGHEDLARGAAIAGVDAAEEAGERRGVEGASALQDLAERRHRELGLHRGHEARDQVDTVDALRDAVPEGPAELGELEPPGGALAVERSEQITERGSREAARQLHASALSEAAAAGQDRGVVSRDPGSGRVHGVRCDDPPRARARAAERSRRRRGARVARSVRRCRA